MANEILAILPRAEAQIQEAFTYLEEQRPGHGHKFLDRYREAVEEAIVAPGIGINVPDFPEQYDARKHQMKQFMYSIYVATLGDRRTIIAVHYQQNKDDRQLLLK